MMPHINIGGKEGYHDSVQAEHFATLYVPLHSFWELRETS